MWPLRALIPFVACSVVQSHLVQSRRDVQVRQTLSASSSVENSASPVVSTTSAALSSASACVTPSFIMSTTSSPVSMPPSISEIISMDPTSDSTPTTAASSKTQTTLTDPSTREGNSHATDSTTTSPRPSIATTVPATSPTGPSQVAAPTTTMTPPTPLNDCLGGIAACTFTPTSTARSYYTEMTPLGLPLENCNDRNETVTAHFSGAVTLSENWSVEVESGFSLPGEIEIGLDVKTSFEKGKEIQMAQGFDYPIPPDTKAALVGSASFTGIFGNMEMTYHSSNSQTVQNVVYFKGAENPNPVALLMVVGCDQSWPAWNATPAIPTSGASVAGSRLSCFVIIGLVITALLT